MDTVREPRILGGRTVVRLRQSADCTEDHPARALMTSGHLLDPSISMDLLVIYNQWSLLQIVLGSVDRVSQPCLCCGQGDEW